MIGAEQEVGATTTDLNEINEVLTEMQDDDDDQDDDGTTTQKTLTANELKFEGITTTTGVRSIMDDNQIMTTPIPEDLQLSESITSVYLHNSSLMPSLSDNNIQTSPKTKPKKDSVNSITLMPFSKLTNQILDSDSRSDSSRNDEPPSASTENEENIFTVTPVYVSSRQRQRQTTTPVWQQMEYDTTTTTTTTEAASENDSGDENIPTTTLSDSQQDLASMYSGQYHEDNPGQYHEVNPGQYHEINPGQYHEISPGNALGFVFKSV